MSLNDRQHIANSDNQTKNINLGGGPSKGDVLSSTPPFYFCLMKDSFYFPHDCNAHRDEKIVTLRMKFGWEGYGIYWAIIETLFETTGHKYPLNKLDRLAYNHSIDMALLQDVIALALAEGLFKEEKGYFYSESLMRRIAVWEEEREKKRNAGLLGAKSRWHRHSTVVASKGKESTGKEIKKEDITSFWEYFLLKTKKKYSLTDERKKLIMRRLADYSLDDLKKAVDNFVADTWEGRKDHLDLIYCIGKQKGKPDNLEKWLNNSKGIIWKKP